MKTTFYNFKSLNRLNLQLFAEDDGAEGSSSEDTNTNPEGADGFQAPQSQSELDSLIGKAVNKALSNAKRDWEAETHQKINDARSEAEEFANMTAEQKAAKQEKERLSKLEEREQSLLKRELKAEAIDSLIEKNLPKGLADIPTYLNAEDTSKHIEIIETSFRQAVEDEVNKRLLESAGAPGGTGNSAGGNPHVELGERLGKESKKSKKPNTYFKN